MKFNLMSSSDIWLFGRIIVLPPRYTIIRTPFTMPQIIAKIHRNIQIICTGTQKEAAALLGFACGSSLHNEIYPFSYPTHFLTGKLVLIARRKSATSGKTPSAKSCAPRFPIAVDSPSPASTGFPVSSAESSFK